jgi:hypothetical protein
MVTQNINSLNYLAAKIPSDHKNLGAATNAVVKATPGFVNSLTCYNTNAASRFLLLFNQTTALTGAEVPVESFLIPTGTQIVIGEDYFTRNGRFFDTGIVWGFSTTANSFTAGTASEQSTFIKYK